MKDTDEKTCIDALEMLEVQKKMLKEAIGSGMDLGIISDPVSLLKDEVRGVQVQDEMNDSELNLEILKTIKVNSNYSQRNNHKMCHEAYLRGLTAHDIVIETDENTTDGETEDKAYKIIIQNLENKFDVQIPESVLFEKSQGRFS